MDRALRPIRRGGGVVLFVHISIECFDLYAFRNDNLEYVLLKLFTGFLVD